MCNYLYLPYTFPTIGTTDSVPTESVSTSPLPPRWSTTHAGRWREPQKTQSARPHSLSQPARGRRWWDVSDGLGARSTWFHLYPPRLCSPVWSVAPLWVQPIRGHVPGMHGSQWWSPPTTAATEATAAKAVRWLGQAHNSWHGCICVCVCMCVCAHSAVERRRWASAWSVWQLACAMQLCARRRRPRVRGLQGQWFHLCTLESLSRQVALHTYPAPMLTFSQCIYIDYYI